MRRKGIRNGTEDVEGQNDIGLLDEKRLEVKKIVSNQSAWAGFWHKCKRVWPFIWPSNDCRLQLKVIACVIILVASRAVNVLIPVLQKYIINSMTSSQAAPVAMENDNNFENGARIERQPTTAEMQQATVHNSESETAPFKWDAIIYWIILKTLQGDSGYLNIVRTLLWIAVSQDTRKKMRIKLFKHLHSLSIRWHLHRKTGEVLRVMDRGVNSINVVLSHAIFNLLPVIADVIIAVVFFITMFSWWLGLIVFSTMLLYAVFTVCLSEWRTKFRRQMNEANNEQDAASVDSILNFETVKYHAAEDFEAERYAEAVDKHLRCEFLVSTSLSLLNFFQKTAMGVGLLGGSLICARSVYLGQLTVGDYVLFVSYVEQLYGPLNALGMYYRLMQQAFIDMENMFEMLDQKVEVLDDAGAVPLEVNRGEIKFDKVTFHYNSRKPLVENVSFVVPPGKTYALVGPSGGGKSTVIRLLLRFYDIQSGRILIDGQDIAKVTQQSLRQQIGVVPQDTVLFNNDVRFNIRYGKQSATNEEVLSAAQTADIHNFIHELPDGYDTLVGERGLRLSGGEKQRIAIARTLLKDPRIVLLDEATSALDTRTERNIQNSLSKMCENRTTVVVAHRLSTVIDADQILVIRDGAIVERGRHDELLQLGRIYSSMWLEQLRSNVREDEMQDKNPCHMTYPATFSSGLALNSPNSPRGLPAITRSLSVPTSNPLRPETYEEQMALVHTEEVLIPGSTEYQEYSDELCRQPRLERSKREWVKKNLISSHDRGKREFLSTPVDLQKICNGNGGSSLRIFLRQAPWNRV